MAGRGFEESSIFNKQYWHTLQQLHLEGAAVSGW